ncbi:ATP-dependent DNA helicase pif1-like [Acropora palmata]|uniref:ATP-dependent DNA helicase pif1-like n=1 Tax=Acropora palmata TaxID=6131 RepID=UPI003DA08F9A
MALNAEQLAALKFVADGHNIFITGKAGVGKSRPVTSILSDCESWNMKVAVVCSSRIACSVDGRGTVYTVHSFYGLGTAEIPANMILERSTAIASLINKIRNVDIIIWDEASMSSSRILELVNLLHQSLAVDS